MRVGLPFFGLLRQPAAQFTKADNIIAMIILLGRGRQAKRLVLGKEHEFIFGRLNFQRRAFFFPVRNKLIQSPWLERRTDTDALKFKRWVELQVIEPYRRRQERAGD